MIGSEQFPWFPTTHYQAGKRGMGTISKHRKGERIDAGWTEGLLEETYKK